MKIIWKKHELFHMDENGNRFDSDTQCVSGVDNNTGYQIGHYMKGHKENEICCCVNIEDENGGSVFINRTFVFDDMSNFTDQLCREKIINTYNKILTNKSQIMSLFD